MTKASLTQVGYIASAHGIRGQVKLRSLCNPPEAIFTLDPITDSLGQRKFKIQPAGGNSVKDGVYLAHIEGIGDRNAAELLKGMGLYVSTAILPAKSEDEWDMRDLIGLQTRCADGKPYGQVVEVYNFGAGDIIEIKRLDSSMEMLPFTSSFIGTIQIKDGFIVVFPPDYVEEEAVKGK